MSLNKHERFIREKLKGQEVDLDKDALWEAVKPVKKSDNRKYFILLILLIGSVSALLLSKWNTPENEGISENLTQDQKEQTPYTTTSSEEISVLKSSDVEISGSNEIHKNSNSTNITDTQNLKATTTSNSITQFASKNVKPVSTLTATTFQNEITKSKSTVPVIKEESSGSNSPKNKIGISKNQPSKAITQNTTPLHILNNYKKSDLNLDENTLFPSDLNSEQRMVLDLNSLANLNLLSPIENIESDFTPSNYIHPIRKKKWALALDLEIGTGILFEQLSARQPEDEAYANSVSQIEKPLDFYHGQIGIKLEHSKLPIYLKTGLSYSRITSRIGIDNTIYKDTLINGTQYYDIGNDGSRSVVEGEVMAVLVTDYRAKWHTYHHMLDIPILIGYQVYNTPSFGLAIEGGLRMNILNYSKGAYLQDDGFLSKFTNNDNNIYKSNLGINLHAGINARYLVTRNNTFSLRASWTQYGEFAKSQSELSKKYQVLGINLGVEHRF